MVDGQADHDRQRDDLHDAHQHAVDVDGNRGVDVQAREQRRGEHADQRRQRADRHRQRDVAARQIDHHVRRGAACDAADQHHAGGQLGRHPQQLGERPGGERHHEVMQHDAGEHGRGAREDAAEIGDRQRDAHRQHDQREQRGDVRRDRREGGRRDIRGERDQHGPQRKESGNPGKHGEILGRSGWCGGGPRRAGGQGAPAGASGAGPGGTAHAWQAARERGFYLAGRAGPGRGRGGRQIGGGSRIRGACSTRLGRPRGACALAAGARGMDEVRTGEDEA